MPVVNLFIAGTQKGGTTALAEFLAAHPEVCMVRNKEAHIFDRPDIEQLTAQQIDAAYHHLLPHCRQQPVRCDATPLYMFYPDIAGRLAAYNPAAKVIILLREPAERALSQYQMEQRRGDEPLGFARALLAERRRLRADTDARRPGSAWRLHSYRHRGYYSAQLDNLYRHFAKEQVLVLRNSDLLNEHQATLDRVTAFLGLARLECPPKRVFSGGYRASTGQRLALGLLRLAYWREYRRLRRHHGIVFGR